jgi:RHS repeat-associated protein
LPSTLTHHHTVKQSRKSYSGKYFAYQSKRKSIPNPSFTKGRELYEYDESKTRVIKHNESTGKITQYINDFFDIEDGQEKLYFYSGDLKLATLDSSSSAPTGDPDECDVPTSGNWTITQDCTIATFETAPADVTITAGTVLTIASSGILEVDLNTNSLTVENGGGILIENGGSLAQVGVLSPLPGGTQGGVELVFHHSDHLSGASVDTDESGSVVALNDYYPFGDTRIESGEYENDYTYTGKERDEDTELLYYEARYYNSNIGRFISIDPWSGDITDPQSLNKYAYVRNNPLKYVDPEGENFIMNWFMPAAYSDDVEGTEGDYSNLSQQYQAENPQPETIGQAAADVVEVADKISDVSFKGLGKQAIKKLAKKADDISKNAKKTYQIYLKKNKETGKVYTGRTSGTGTPDANVKKRDYGHGKLNGMGYGPAQPVPGLSTTNKDAIRGAEQKLIDKFKAAGISGNIINGISKNNPKRDRYMKAASKIFKAFRKKKKKTD